jgi:hypothetical protein
MKNLIFFFLSLTLSFSLPAQTDTVKGYVYDATDSMPIFNGFIFTANDYNKSMTDLDGNFMVYNVPAGKNFIKVAAMGYDTTKEKINVKEGQVISLQIYMKRNNAVNYGWRAQYIPHRHDSNLVIIKLKYDQKINLTAMTRDTFGNGDGITKVYKYNYKDQLVEYDYYCDVTEDTGGYTAVELYKYDEAGQRTEIFRAVDGGDIAKIVFIYNDQHQLVRREEFNNYNDFYSMSNKIKIAEYQYDEYGKRTGIIIRTVSDTAIGMSESIKYAVHAYQADGALYKRPSPYTIYQPSWSNPIGKYLCSQILIHKWGMSQIPMRTNKEYDALIFQADSCFYYHNFSSAIKYYQKANEIIPGNEYPHTMIMECERFVAEKKMYEQMRNR